jgi:DNA polymerase family A
MTAPAAEAHARELSEIHREYLTAHAVDLSSPDVKAAGIYSDGTCIVVPWRDGKRVTLQRRPWPGNSGEYYWEPETKLHLNILRDPSPGATVLLCEGTKQSLAVASWAPPEYAVMGMPGCYGWVTKGDLDLSRFAGRQVLVMLDADAAGNLDVWEAGEKLAFELGMEDATALFIPSPSWGKDGIDDYLARFSAGKRTDRLAKLIERAQDKPADRKPARRKQKADEQQPETAGRPVITVNRDRMLVISDILAVLQQRWGGSELFCYGGVLARLAGSRTEPLDSGSFAARLAEGAFTCRYRKPTAAAPGDYEPDWPDTKTMEAVLSLADRFPPLHRIARVPFFRPDGTACFKNGYDWDTGTFLACGNSGMDRLDIPDDPTAAEAGAAARFLAGEWLGNMPFRDDSSRASALALVLTPFIRGLVPLVPLAVVSGLQPGVGKGLLGDCVSILATGHVQPPLPYVTDDEDEIRKQITAAFRQGTDLFCFDEAHDLKGAALSRALTSITYTDRILGVSKMAEFPNRVTWMSLGNNVEVNADVARRVHWIELYPKDPDPDTRPESAFAHPDLRTWTAENRPELVTAALVMIRAWFAAGRPPHSRGSLMGSFEAWDKMMSGILGHAGVDGFLAGLAARRSESDFTGGSWGDHIAWLHRTFGTEKFTTGDVRMRAQAASGAWDAPPGLDDVMRAGYARELGRSYAKVGPRWFSGIRLAKIGRGHNNTTQWVIERLEEVNDLETLSDLGGGNQGGSNSGQGGIKIVYPPASGDMGVRENGTLPDLGVSKPNTTSPATGDWGDRGDISKASRVRAIAHDAHAHDTRSHARATPAGIPLIPPIPPQPSSQVSGFSSAPPQVSTCAPLAHPPVALNLLGIDLETASADELFLRPRDAERSFVRLAGAIGPSGQPLIISGADLAALLPAAAEITGHNILGFDGLALAWHHGLDWEAFAARARDTEIIARQWDPPKSKEAGKYAEKYDLDHVAERLGLSGKTDDIRRLKRKHGGWDRIPLDDPEYRAYLEGDLRATMAVAGLLGHDDYTRREHRLAAIAGRMSLNGFAVDQPLLADRLAGGEDRKRRAIQVLHDGWGLPLGKTVTRGRGEAKHEEFEEAVSPLSTNPGRAWLESAWERYGVTDPPRTGTGLLSVKAEDLKRIMNDPRTSPELRSMLAVMEIVTTTRTVYQTLTACLAPDGRVHPKVTMRQASGRWSITEPGLTVLGKRNERLVRERDVLVADPGFVLMSFDLSQVDMRSMAGHSQDPAYMALFGTGPDGRPRDVHKEIAAQVFGTADRRQDAKKIGHGWNYGMGPERMIDKEGIAPDLAYAFDNGMRERFPVLCAWREEIRALGKSGQILDNGFGRRMRCDPRWAHTVAPALMGQGGAADIMKEVMLRTPRELDKHRLAMVHDEQVFQFPVADAAEMAREVVKAMTWEWRGVPITCDQAGPGSSWGEISAK